MHSPKNAHSSFFSLHRPESPLTAACQAGLAPLCGALMEALSQGRAISAFLLTGDIQRAGFSVPEREQITALCANGICTIYEPGRALHAAECLKSFAQLARHLIDAHTAQPTVHAPDTQITSTLAERVADLARRVFDEETLGCEHSEPNGDSEWLSTAYEIARLSKALRRHAEAHEGPEALSAARLPQRRCRADEEQTPSPSAAAYALHG